MAYGRETQKKGKIGFWYMVAAFIVVVLLIAYFLLPGAHDDGVVVSSNFDRSGTGVAAPSEPAPTRRI